MRIVNCLSAAFIVFPLVMKDEDSGLDIVTVDICIPLDAVEVSGVRLNKWNGKLKICLNS